MIVLTSVNKIKCSLLVGDTFQMRITDGLEHKVLIQEEIAIDQVVDFVASYRFALEDGTCPGFHLSGIFGNSKELPIEIQNAIRFEDLPPDKKENFINSVGIKL